MRLHWEVTILSVKVAFTERLLVAEQVDLGLVQPVIHSSLVGLQLSDHVFTLIVPWGNTTI